MGIACMGASSIGLVFNLSAFSYALTRKKSKEREAQLRSKSKDILRFAVTLGNSFGLYLCYKHNTRLYSSILFCTASYWAIYGDYHLWNDQRWQIREKRKELEKRSIIKESVQISLMNWTYLGFVVFVLEKRML